MNIGCLGKKKKLRIYFFIILTLLLFHMVNNYIILSLDNTFPAYDEWDRLSGASDISLFLKDLNCKNTRLSEVCSWYRNLGDRCRAPLYEVTLSLYCLIQKNINADRITITNMFYFMIILLSVYGIGAKLKNKATGVLAAFIVSMFPGIFAMSRGLMVDFPLTAMVSLSVCLLLFTRYFVDRKYSFLFGVSIGLGLLTKVTYIVFIPPLLVCYVLISLIGAIKEKKQFIIITKNLIISLVSGLFIASLWYLPNLHKIINRAKAMSLQLHNSPHGSFIDFYIESLFSHSLCPFFFILYLFSLSICLIKRKGVILWLWLLLPLLIFSFSPNKAHRFILPALPSIALTIALGINLIKSYLIKKRIIIFTGVFSLFIYFAISYGAVYWFKIYLFHPEISSFFPGDRVGNGLYFPCNGRMNDWRIEDIGEVFLNNIDINKTKKIKILSIFNIGKIHNVLDYYLTSKGVITEIYCPAQADFFDSPSRDAYDRIAMFDFVMTKDGDMGENAGHIDWIEILTSNFERQKEEFYLIGQIKEFSGQSNVYIFKNRGNE